MSLTKEAEEEYISWMEQDPQFKGIVFKIDYYHEHAFPRLVIKYRKQLVALDAKVDMSLTGQHLSPAEWKEMMAKNDDKVLVDVRNDYEWKVGHFEGAELPKYETFREFQTYASQLKEKVDPEKTPVMMYCTGGIRCEVYSAYLKQMGFEKVFQLEGGIINYGHKEGNSHWLGKLFVFDDRLTVPISEEPAPVIGKCHHCEVEIENYFNCANMDCNKLFLCCPECIKEHLGCCTKDCQQSPKIRPYQQQNPHKPFRRWYQYFNKKPD